MCALSQICYSAYPAKYSFFVNQGINLLYVIFGGAILLPRIIWTQDVTPEVSPVLRPTCQ